MKKKNKNRIWLRAAGISILVISTFLISSGRAAPTYIDGIIYSDTTWSLKNSPYIVKGNIKVVPEVTLTIEQGVEVLYAGPYEIYVLGSIVANGTPEEKIVFTSTDAVRALETTFLRFEGTDLSDTQLSHIVMSHAANAIYERYNTGILNADNINIIDAAIINYSAELVITDSQFNYAYIDGNDWGDGKIEISNSVITNSKLIAGNLHRGLTIIKSTAVNTLFDIRYIGNIRDSYLRDCNVKTNSNIRVMGQTVKISNSSLINSPVELPEADLSVRNSRIEYSGNNGIICRRGRIEGSKVIGNGSGVGILARGKSLYILNSDIMHNSIGIILTAYAAATIENCNIYENNKFNIVSRSRWGINAQHNYWGTISPFEIAEKIYDYYDDNNFGIVDYSYYRNYPDEDNNTDIELKPKIFIEIKPEEITSGDKIEITVIGADDDALTTIWWKGDNTGNAELDGKHIYNCSTASFSQSWTIDTESLAPGTYIIKAGAVDTSGLEVVKSAAFNVVNPIIYVEPVLMSVIDSNLKETEVTSFYRVYWDRGEGKIDYDNPVAIVEKSKIIWEEDIPVLTEDKTYRFAIKAVDVNGNEEYIHSMICVARINSELETVVTGYGGATKVVIPPKAVQEDKLILEIIEEPLDILPVPEDLRPIGEYRNIKILKNGEEAVLDNEMSIVIQYNDNNQDGIVDGTTIPETALVILWYNPDSNEWERDFVTYVDIDKNTCSINTKRQGLFAIFSPVSFVPKSVRNLSGKVEGERIKLGWDSSLSAKWDAYNIYIKDGEYYEKIYNIHYNVYFDGGTGEIDYSKPISKLDRSKLTWTSHKLRPGTYRFGIRVEDIEGNEEKNNLYVEIEISEPAGDLKAYINVPKDGKRIRGNAVTVMAETDDRSTAVQFQYKKFSEEEWINITTLDMKKPYSVYWNVSRVENGEYLLRAIAYDSKGYPDSEPASIKVIVDDVNWDIHEDGNPDVDPNNEHRKSEKIYINEETKVVIADGTGATVPAGVISADKTILDITILNPKKVEKDHPPKESSIKPIGVFRRFEMRNGEHLFDKDITISIPYDDEDRDGIVDGTDIREEDLKVFYLDEEEGGWIDVSGDNNKGRGKGKKASSVQTVNEIENTVIVKVNHFTIFALMAYVSADNLSDVIVYPNPFKPNSGIGHETVTFDGLTENVKIRIFTIAGRLVREWEGNTAPDYQWEWGVKNDAGDEVVSGVYIYVITSDEVEMEKGKIAVIR